MTDGLDPTTVITSTGAAAPLLAAVLALLVSIILLRMYRRAVLKSMGARATSFTTDPAPLEASTSANRPVPTASGLSALDDGSSFTARPAAAALHSNLLRTPWRAAAIYGVAGACYALVLAGSSQIAQDMLTPVRLLVFAWVLAWPVVLTVNLVAATTLRTRLVTAAVYFLGLVLVSAIGVALGSKLTWGQGILLWAQSNLLPTVVLLTFLNRRVRAVGPLVVTFLAVAIAGSGVAFIVALNIVALNAEAFSVAVLNVIGWAFTTFLDPLVGLIAPLAVQEVGVARIALGSVLEVVFGLNTLASPAGVLGFAVFALAGLLALRWIRRRYERKKTSDQAITLDAIWLLFAVFFATRDLAFEGLAWMIAGLVAFAVYKAVAWAGFRLLGSKAEPGRESPKLLLLRVFSLGRRSERLFDKLAKHWRHGGSIQLIAGPDLATTTIEPHEFLDFLNRKLARRFIDGPRTLDLRLSEMDLEPDRDGRFRVNDFFCHEDTWRMVLSRLVSESDAVLMDLRGFSSQNAGVTYEIEELTTLVALERVVFVVDDTTDEQFLHQTVQRSWDRAAEASPNRLPESPELRLFRLKGSGGGELKQLLRSVCVAARPAHPGAPEARTVAATA